MSRQTLEIKALQDHVVSETLSVTVCLYCRFSFVSGTWVLWLIVSSFFVNPKLTHPCNASGNR
jgi:hypothetical protein